MRWPLYLQLLVPVAGLAVAAVVVNALFAAAWASDRRTRETTFRLTQVAAVLAEANFPRSPAVLDRMRQLTGAEFVVRRLDTRQVVSTLENPLDQGALSQVFNAPAGAADRNPLLDIDGRRYRAVAVPQAALRPQERIAVLYPEDTLWRDRRDAALPALLVGLGSIAVLVAILQWLSRRFVRRIGRVERMVAAVAAGDYTPLPQDPGWDDELARLTGGVNHLGGQLAELHSRIERSERIRLLNQFAGGLAHQLRNAIAGAKLAVQIHGRRCQGPAEDSSLQVALRQLTLTEHQLRGLLVAGRTSPAQRTRTDPKAVTREVEELVRPACVHAEVELTLEIAAEAPEVCVDADGLQAALINLALNASQAAGRNGRVRLELSATVTASTAAAAVWRVWDSGPGLSAEVSGRWGEPFVTGRPDGVGLGLALARQFATDHGGTLEWRRDADETCFELIVPAAARPHAKVATEPRESHS